MDRAESESCMLDAGHFGMASGARHIDLNQLLSGSIAAIANGVEQLSCTVTGRAGHQFHGDDVANSFAFRAVSHMTTRQSNCEENPAGRPSAIRIIPAFSKS